MASSSTTGGGLITEVGRRVASPVAIVIGVPLLVLVTGLAVGWNGQRALTASVERAVDTHFSDRCDQLKRWLAQSIGSLPELLHRSAQLLPTDGVRDEAEIAVLLAGQLQRQAALAYISWSTSDGSYRGVQHEDAHTISYTITRSGSPTQPRRQRFRLRGTQLSPLTELESTDYDPRRRPFWQVAVAAPGPAWTEVYPFFADQAPGITCALALRDASGSVTAVLTADLDLRSLSAITDGLANPRERSLVFDHDGTVLAYPDYRGRLQQFHGQGLPRLGDLDDPLLRGLDTTILGPSRQGQELINTLYDSAVGAVRVRAERWRLPGSQRTLWIAHLAPNASLRAPLDAHVASSRLVGAVVLAIAVLIALLFARHVTRQRQALARAKARARAAEDEARELGAYRLIKRLGQGGMGEVWQAEHRLLARPAALKLIRATNDSIAPAHRGDIEARFRREARIIATLASPHTVSLFDFGVSDDGTFYYVMELLNGLDVDVLVKRHGPQPPCRVLRMLRQAAASLAEAHDRGLVHRDMKPANLFLCRLADELDWIKVLDFGIALVHGPSDSPGITKDNIVVGTPGYMSPEHARGKALDGRADLYALACIGWWLLCGQPVFPDEGPGVAVLLRHINDPLPDLATCCPHPLPKGIIELFQDCLAKNAEQRPANARALISRIDEILASADNDWSSDQAKAWWLAHGGGLETDVALATAGSHTWLRIGH